MDMVNVTDYAASTLSQTLQENATKDGQVLRLAPAQEGLALVLDEEQDGDHVIVHEDRKVLVIEREIAESLSGSVIDAVETPEGRRFVVHAVDGS
jgi:Fe-S cluster assembly iron-binding protein IscA